MKIQPVNPQYIHSIWPSIEGFLSDSINRSVGVPTYTLDNLRDRLALGLWDLYVAIADDNTIKAAAVVNTYMAANYNVAHIIALGGRNVCSAENSTKFMGLLKLKGCTLVRASGRPSVMRLLRKFQFGNPYSSVEAVL